jgi:hypothetical protein
MEGTMNFKSMLTVLLWVILLTWDEKASFAKSFEPVVRFVWTSQGQHQTLLNWDPSNFQKLKWITASEKEPATGKMLKWSGVVVSQLLDMVLEELPLESRAQVDLLVLKNELGQVAFLPRALIIKYPFLFAHEVGVPGQTIHSVVPWSSRPKIMKEDVPIENYYMANVTHVELTSYKDQFSHFFLKRRTDPSAIRGEKIFVQNCVSCHRSENLRSENLTERLTSKVHSREDVASKLVGRDRRSIVRYLEAYALENPVALSHGGAVGGSVSNATQ